jgi:hypothetical protein
MHRSTLYETDRCEAADGQRRELAKVRIGCLASPASAAYALPRIGGLCSR